MICKLTGQGTPRVGGWLESRLESLEIVETAVRDSAFLNPAGKPQRAPEGQDKLDAIETEARETAKALGKILKQLGV